jgi:ADP-ribose pyrophosphatase
MPNLPLFALNADPKAVELLEVKRTFQGYFAVDQYRLRYRRFDGSWSPPVEREVFERGHAAALLLFDPHLDQLVLLEQFRVGALPAQRPPWMLEIVAGIIDEGESAEGVAARECQEEAGLTLLRLEPIFTYMPSPGGAAETIHLFIGQVDAAKAGGVFGLAEEAEDIKVHILSLGDAITLCDAGKVENAATLIALYWLARHHTNLRQRWRDAPALEGRS